MTIAAGGIAATRLETMRLCLRPFTRDDGDDLLAMDGDARVMRYVGTGLGARTRDQVEAGLGRMLDTYAQRPGFGLLHVRRRSDSAFVGGCGLFDLADGSGVEIAYRLRHDCWGRGYATEAARAVLAHGLEALAIGRIVGLAYPDNAASQRVLAKIGMRDLGTTDRYYGRELRLFAADRDVRGPAAGAAAR